MGEPIEIKEELLADCFDEMKPLFMLHWEEIAIHKEKISLNPDYDQYLQMEADGSVVAFIVRKAGVIVGYSIFFLAPHPHYKDNIYANNDIIYIAEEHRRGGMAVSLLQFSEQALRENRGVSVIMVSMKVAYPFDDLMIYLDYGLIERTYSKYIGE